MTLTALSEAKGMGIIMNKYDTHIELQNNNSLAYMIKNIQPNSTVLEVGPATGYMTKYLKDELQCKVYIVEIDKDAYQKANNYAQKGFCGNIEENEWIKEFNDIKFDVITFADVLEHLSDPEKVLNTVKDFLKPDGRIIISVPNIAHNAVLVNLFNNTFEYTNTGLLDNTHIHFFSYDSIYKMIHRCGYVCIEQSSVNFDYQYAGLNNSKNDVPDMISYYLDTRKYGFVYQFLFILKNKTDNEVSSQLEYIKKCESCMYIDSGNDFNEEEKEQTEIVIQDNYFKGKFSLKNFKHIKELRFDPINSQCVISQLTIKADIGLQGLEILSNATGYDDSTHIFILSRPSFYIKASNLSKVKYIEFSGQIRNLSLSETIETIQKWIQSAQEKANAEIEHMQRRFEEVNQKTICQYTKKLEENASEIKRINIANIDKQNKIKETEKIILHMQEVNKLLNYELDENTKTVETKNQELMNKEQELVINNQKLMNKEQELLISNQKLEQIYSTKIWKLYKFFKRK